MLLSFLNQNFIKVLQETFQRSLNSHSKVGILCTFESEWRTRAIISTCLQSFFGLFLGLTIERCLHSSGAYIRAVLTLGKLKFSLWKNGIFFTKMREISYLRDVFTESYKLKAAFCSFLLSFCNEGERS